MEERETRVPKINYGIVYLNWQFIFVMGGITTNKRVGYVLETLDRLIKISEKWNLYWSLVAYKATHWSPCQIIGHIWYVLQNIYDHRRDVPHRFSKRVLIDKKNQSTKQLYIDIQCSDLEEDDEGRQEKLTTIEQEMSISIHCPRIGHAMMQMLCGDTQVEHWCRQLLQGWECVTIASCDLSSQYWPAWTNFVDVMLSICCRQVHATVSLLGAILKSVEIFYRHWKAVYSSINHTIYKYIYSLISNLLNDLQSSNPWGKGQTWLQESGVKLQRVVAHISNPLYKRYIIYIYIVCHNMCSVSEYYWRCPITKGEYIYIYIYMYVYIYIAMKTPIKPDFFLSIIPLRWVLFHMLGQFSFIGSETQ